MVWESEKHNIVQQCGDCDAFGLQSKAIELVAKHNQFGSWPRNRSEAQEWRQRYESLSPEVLAVAKDRLDKWGIKPPGVPALNPSDEFDGVF